jgi:chromosome segregation ATPase
MDPAVWFQASGANINAALEQVQSAQQLGAQIHVSLDQCWKNQMAQAASVDVAFSQRIGEVDSARQNNEVQIGRTRDELTAQQQIVAELEAAINAKVDPLKLATTRLSTRAGRPSQERTADAAHHSLVSEAETLDFAMQQLDQQLAEAESDMAALTDTLNNLLHDLETKEISLKIDRSCASLRSLHADRRPRRTEYHTTRSPHEWKHFGRTRGMRLG